MITPPEAYKATRQILLQILPEVDGQTEVAACPGWSIRDVVAHLTGLPADFLAGNLPTGNVDDWTNAQVLKRRDLEFASVLAEWDGLVADFTAAMAGPLARGAPRFAADLVSHTFDIAGASSVEIPKDTASTELALSTFVTMLGARLDSAAVGAIRIEAGPSSFVAGTGQVVATVRSSTHEVLRALSGRRTAPQILAFDWDVPAEPYLDLISAFPLPTDPLPD